VPHQQPAETAPHDRRGTGSIEPSQTPEVRPGYLAFVAHEMRNPLATALWSAELLVRLAPSERAGARGEKLAGMCLRTLGRLRHLMEDHFLIDRLAISGIPLRVEPVALADALSAAEKRAGAECARSLQVPSIPADKVMLERALEALVAAAARDQTPVRVESEVEPGATVAIRVLGAPPPGDALEPPGRSTPPDPTGRALGLLMASAVAKAHGGGLAVTPQGYVLTVPAVAQRPEEGA
jgi:signal transduction histidine kinase